MRETSEQALLRALKRVGELGSFVATRPFDGDISDEEQKIRYNKEHRGRPLATELFFHRLGVPSENRQKIMDKYRKEMERADDRT